MNAMASRRAMAWGLGLAALGAAAVLALHLLGPGQAHALADALWSHRDAVQAWSQQVPLQFLLGFVLLFTLLSALAVPGCGVLGLVAGLCWGGALGALVMSAAATMGATVAFLAARHLARDRVLAWLARHAAAGGATARRRRWAQRVQGLEALLQHHPRESALALLSLRLAPVLPFPMVNPLMGLGPMPWRTFAAVSFVGMLPASAAYAWAGAWLADGVPASGDALLQAFGQGGHAGSFATPLAILLVGLAAMPWAGLWLWRRATRRITAAACRIVP